MATTTTPSRTVSLRFPAPLYDRLTAAAAADHRSVNSLVGILLAEALDRRGL